MSNNHLVKRHRFDRQEERHNVAKDVISVTYQRMLCVLTNPVQQIIVHDRTEDRQLTR